MSATLLALPRSRASRGPCLRRPPRPWPPGVRSGSCSEISARMLGSCFRPSVPEYSTTGVSVRPIRRLHALFGGRTGSSSIGRPVGDDRGLVGDAPLREALEERRRDRHDGRAAPSDPPLEPVGEAGDEPSEHREPATGGDADRLGVDVLVPEDHRDLTAPEVTGQDGVREQRHVADDRDARARARRCDARRGGRSRAPGGSGSPRSTWRTCRPSGTPRRSRWSGHRARAGASPCPWCRRGSAGASRRSPDGPGHGSTAPGPGDPSSHGPRSARTVWCVVLALALATLVTPGTAQESGNL